MTKQDKINACTSILSTYTGADKYILMMQRDYNFGYSLSDFAVDYIIANYTNTPEVVNRIVKIQPWLGEEKANIWKIDFVPEVLYVTTLYGETKTSYCCDVVYRKSNPVPTLTFLPKNGIIGPIRVDDFHSRIIDIEPYNEALRKINPSYSIMPHQVESIKFLLARKKCILALDQGLGKSLVSVVASMMVPNSKVLIICPASLKSNWRDEIVRFSPENSVSIISSTRDMNKSELLEFLGLPDNGKLKVNELREMAEAKGKWNPGSRFTILNYDIIDEFHKLPANRSKLAKEQALRDSKLLSSRFDIVIIDEAHRLSNNASNRSKEFRFDNTNYQNPDFEKQKQKAINEIKSREIICPKCNMPITDVSSAMADKSTGKPVHFDCVLNQLKENEPVGENEKIAYIGQGRFAVLYYENPRDQKKFVIKKIIEFFNPLISIPQF